MAIALELCIFDPFAFVLSLHFAFVMNLGFATSKAPQSRNRM